MVLLTAAWPLVLGQDMMVAWACSECDLHFRENRKQSGGGEGTRTDRKRMPSLNKHPSDLLSPKGSRTSHHWPYLMSL